MPSKSDYVFRSLSKISHKRQEHYVVTRVFHTLNDPEIEFSCQQLVRLNDAQYALCDMYFPQFNLNLEINEGRHIDNTEADKLRAQGIREAVGAETIEIWTVDKRTKELRELSELDKDVAAFVEEIQRQKQISGDSFTPWNFEEKFSPEPHLQNGNIHSDGEVFFQYQKDALRCFGYQGGHYQRGTWHVPRTNLMIWFPRIGEGRDWRNTISKDRKKIAQTYIGKERPNFRKPEFPGEIVVFAKSKTPLGQNFYRFTGVFKLESQDEAGISTTLVKIRDEQELPHP